MLKTELNDCEHEIQFHIGPDHKECHFCKRYPHKTLRAHCSLCYKKLLQNLRTNYPENRIS